MVICGFVLAIVFFLLWPHEPSPFIAPTMLAATALIYAAARYIGSQSLRRVAYILLAMGLGFGWAQTRTYNEATQTGEAVFGRMQVSGMVDWHEAQARGSRWDIRLQDAQGRFFMVRLYGKQADLVRAQPGCGITLTADIQPLPRRVIRAARNYSTAALSRRVGIVNLQLKRGR